MGLPFVEVYRISLAEGLQQLGNPFLVEAPGNHEALFKKSWMTLIGTFKDLDCLFNIVFAGDLREGEIGVVVVGVSDERADVQAALGESVDLVSH